MIRIWDPVVRAFHWALVVVFTLAWLTADGGGAWHEAAGYAAAGLVGLRLIRGLVGSRYARFSQFIHGPAAVAQYLRQAVRGRERRYLGHNPAGAAMIVAILLTMSATAFTGWLVAEPTRLAYLPAMPQIVATAYADSDGHRKGGDTALKGLHETLADLMLVLIGLHVAGVVFASVRHKENLTGAMITGDKRRPEPGDIS